MNWIRFDHCNRMLAKESPKDQAPFFPGQFFTDGTNSVYCFLATWKERIAILFFGRVWLTMKLGKDIAPAMMVSGKRTVFEIPGKNVQVAMVAKSSCRRCHGRGSLGLAAGKEILCDCLRPKDEVKAQGHKVVNIRS